MYEKLADYDNALVISTANSIVENASSLEEKLECIFLYVRDKIKFGFHEQSDFLKASEVIQAGIGQCNNKSTLFVALAKALGISVRVHFSSIDKRIQQGLFRGLAYKLMPKDLSHSWTEVLYKGQWIRLDSYVNDKAFYMNAKRKLEEEGLKLGYSIACTKGESSIKFDMSNKHFVQMDAVRKDFSVYDDPADFYQTDNYKNDVKFIKKLIYQKYRRIVNDRINRIRSGDIIPIVKVS